MFGLLTEDRQRVRVYALSGELKESPNEIPIPPALGYDVDEVAYVVNDARVTEGGATVAAVIRTAADPSPRPIEVDLQALQRELVIARGFRSFMRVSVRVRGRLLGGLIFCSRAPDAYPPAEVSRARQIADCVGLAVSHQRLAEEERQSALARERAAHLEARVAQLRAEEPEAKNRPRIVGDSKPWRNALGHATKVAVTQATVLLTGESGTGKEVIARFIHRSSNRAEGPFVALNCAALPEQLLESELFGHEKGAFTGAIAPHAGRIEQAAGGVLFLDEVGEMSPTVQAKFLRVLQEREYQRLGGSRTLDADIRVVAATNRNLKSAISQGSFREDLYYRLAVFEIALPPLRERPDDILLLAEASLEEIGRSVGRPAAGFSEEVREKLVAYPWPGNVRELRNAIERAVILCEGGLITSEHLPMGIVASSPVPTPAPAAAAAAAPPATAAMLVATEREMILQALARAGNNKSKAARLLGLTRAQLRTRIEKHGIDTEA